MASGRGKKNAADQSSGRPLRFIDLFAGLGGFHLALKQLGHKCVFACEIDEVLTALYEKNFGLRPHGDIRILDLGNVPSHDILCAGFPCQPFSKAGGQEGFRCPQWGDLIDYVIKILRMYKPQYFIIENVPNLVRHGQGKTWRTIEHRLRLAGYSVSDALLSPHQFGVPQIRDRAFILSAPATGKAPSQLRDTCNIIAGWRRGLAITRTASLFRTADGHWSYHCRVFLLGCG